MESGGQCATIPSQRQKQTWLADSSVLIAAEHMDQLPLWGTIVLHCEIAVHIIILSIFQAPRSFCTNKDMAG